MSEIKNFSPTSALRSFQTVADVNSFNRNTLEDANIVSKTALLSVDSYGNLNSSVVDHCNELDLKRTRESCLDTAEKYAKKYAMQKVEESIGTLSSGTSFANIGKKMSESFHSLAIPDQVSFDIKKENSIDAIKQFLDSMKNFSSSVQDMRQQAEDDIKKSIDDMNTALSSIAEYNTAALRKDPNNYMNTDKLRTALNDLANIAGFYFLNSQDGTVKVYTDKAGRFPLVDHGKYATFNYQQKQNIDANTAFNPITITYEGVAYEPTLGNQDFTSFLLNVKGALSANIQNRDVLGTSLQTQINKVAANVFTNFNEIHNQGSSTVLRNQVHGSTSILATQNLDVANMTGTVRFALMDQNNLLPSITGGVNYMDVDLSTFNAYVTANAPTTTGTMNDFVAFLNTKFSSNPAIGLSASLQNGCLSLTASNANYGVVFQDINASSINTIGGANPTFFSNFFGLNDLFTNVLPTNHNNFVNFLSIRSDIEANNGASLSVGELVIPSTATGSNASVASIINGTDIAETLSDIWKNQKIMFANTPTLPGGSKSLDDYCMSIVNNHESLTKNMKSVYDQSKKIFDRRREISIGSSKINESTLEAELPNIVRMNERTISTISAKNKMLDELMNLSRR
ncbi:MAG: hypothetical protein CNLJKLNK_01144 [Holosporales bacterium]